MASIIKITVCVLAVLALTKASCVEDAERYKGLIGGWAGPMDMNEEDAIDRVESLAHSAAIVYNQMSSDLRVYEPVPMGNSETSVQAAYTQVVNGLNYCLRFTMQSTGCKNSRAKDEMCADQSMICDAKIYTDFQWTPTGDGSAPNVNLPIKCVSFPSNSENAINLQ